MYHHLLSYLEYEFFCPYTAELTLVPRRMDRTNSLATHLSTWHLGHTCWRFPENQICSIDYNLILILNKLNYIYQKEILIQLTKRHLR